MSCPATCVCHPASKRETCLGVMREEYSDRKLFFGMALRPQNKARPSSATSAIMWLLRSIDHSLSASEARSAWAAGIMLEPGNLPARASAPSPSNCTRSGTNRNSPPIRVVNSRSVKVNSLTLAVASTVGPTRNGRSSSRRRLGRRLVFEVEGPQGLILTLARRRRRGEETPTFCYAIWCSDRHLRTVSCAEPLVKRELHRNTINVEEICFVQGLSAPHRIPVTLGAICQKRKLTTQKRSISALF